MAGPLLLSNLRSTKVFDNIPPKICPATLSVDFDFSIQTTYVIDFNQQLDVKDIEFVQGIYVDNSLNSAALSITNSVTKQKLIWPAFWQGYQPFLWADRSSITVTCADNTQTDTWVQFLTMPTQPVMWDSRSSSGTIAANVTIVNPLSVSGNVKVDIAESATLTVTETTLDTACTPFHLVSAASNNATSVKASAGKVFTVAGYNNTATIAYLKLYNKASAPTPASDTPVQTYLIPANTNGAGFNFSVTNGLSFATGIALAIVGGIGDSDNTSVAANAFVIDIGYV